MQARLVHEKVANVDVVNGVVVTPDSTQQSTTTAATAITTKLPSGPGAAAESKKFAEKAGILCG